MSWFLGLDIGSVNSKGVLIENNHIEASRIISSETNYTATANRIREQLLAEAGLAFEEIAGTVATGSGAERVDFAGTTSPEILCCARGAHYFSPDVRTIIDVGGQSSQAIRINERGKVLNFLVSEKCAVGSGRFLQVIANVLRVKMDDLGPLSLIAKNPVRFNTACAVFGESEAITRVAEGFPKEDIIAGVHRALADKVAALVDKVGLEERCIFTGGGAMDIGLVRVVEQKIGVKLLIFDPPQLVAALGAALVAQEKLGENGTPDGSESNA